MSSERAAVVLGGSGSVGHALIKELINRGAFEVIVTLARRSQPDQPRWRVIQEPLSPNGIRLANRGSPRARNQGILSPNPAKPGRMAA